MSQWRFVDSNGTDRDDSNTANDWKVGLYAWINNAGVLAAGPFDETPIEVHTQVVQTNLLGYINAAHAVLPIFKAQSHGVLINNISIGGFLPVPYGAGYTASKFGLRGFSEALKGELAEWPEILTVASACPVSRKLAVNIF